jgi:pimeloyl-ACP methyl ester carboxylesterase
MEGEVIYDGNKIRYCDNGSGIVVLLLHGYLESSQSWNGFASKLSNKYRVISIDLPGHGLSETNGKLHTMEYMAKGICRILSELKIGKVFIIGHSLGGYVALAFLDLFPEKLFGFCLFHSHPFADSVETIEKRIREIQVVKAGKKNLMYPDNVTKMFASRNMKKFTAELARSIEIASQSPAEGIIAMLNGMMERPSRADLMERGAAPCLWILGRLDNYINCESVICKIALPKNIKVVILEKSGHVGFIEEEDRSLKEVINFIESISVK